MDIEKLMLSKAIMDKASTIGRGQSIAPTSMIENFNVPNAKYNINPEMLGETQSTSIPISNSRNQNGYPVPSTEAIQKSKLPDEIKKLMMEHPIEKPGFQSGPTLSDDLIEKASKLMGTKRPEQEVSQISESTGLRNMLKDVVKEVLRENGMLTESVERTNDKFVFQVGKHVFEGKLTKVKKLS